jgi:hypothetical protein
MLRRKFCFSKPSFPCDIEDQLVSTIGVGNFTELRKEKGGSRQPKSRRR